MAVPEKDELLLKLNELKNRAGNALLNTVEINERNLQHLINRPMFLRPELLLEEPTQRLDELKINIQKNIELVLKQKDQEFKGKVERLRALSPESTMKRGYSIVLTEEDELIKSVDEVDVGDELKVMMTDGKLKTITEEVIKSKKKK